MKARLKFSKTGSMRFIGHLDVMRYFQKAFRRAKVQVSYSQGFSPHQLMSFTSPLGIGLSSDAEYLDITLDECREPEIMIECINAAMNDEIRVKDFSILCDEARPSMSALAACDYMVCIKPEKTNRFLEDDFRKKLIAAFVESEKIEILKKTKKSEKMVDIRQNIYFVTDDMDEFQAQTGIKYGELCLDTDVYKPVLFCQLTAGSVLNIKPELVIEAMCGMAGIEYNPYDYQIHRLEMYADLNGVKGQINTRSSETVCNLVPMSGYMKQET